jgi:hypothetical protein
MRQHRGSLADRVPAGNAGGSRSVIGSLLILAGTIALGLAISAWVHRWLR